MNRENENTFLSEAASVRMFYSSNRRVGEDKTQDQVSPVAIIAEIPERLVTVSQDRNTLFVLGNRQILSFTSYSLIIA